MLRRSLLPPASSTDIAIRALTGQGKYGAVTQIADEYDVSRQKVYRLRDAGYHAITEAFTPAQPTAWNTTLPEADLKRAIVALYVVAPCSTRDIEEVLPILYGVTRSHGFIVNTLHDAQKAATCFLDDIDLSAIEAVAIDEMFWHHNPLLTGIDLDSGFLFSMEKVRQRTGAEWVSHLAVLKEQGLSPSVVVKDAGQAMAEAVGVVWPEAECRDDLFHAIYLLNETARFLENAAYRAIDTFEALVRRSAKEKPGPKRRSLGQHKRHQLPIMNRRIERFDEFERLSGEVKRLLSLCDPGSGKLRRSEEVTTGLPVLAVQIAALGVRRVEKVGRYLSGRAEGLSLYLSALRKRLSVVCEPVGGEVVLSAVVRAYQANLVVGRGPVWDRQSRQSELESSGRALIDVCGSPERLQDALGVILPELQRCHRASSAIENVHSVLRPYIAVHKGVQQGFLDLFRLYWNTRERRWGRHKGSSALETMTGQKVEDWLTLLGFPSSDAFH